MKKLITLTLALLCQCSFADKLAAPITPVKEVQVIAPQDKLIFIEINDIATAKKHLKGDSLKTAEGTNFEATTILLVQWSGSGGDQLSYDVAESFPEQILFKMRRGMTMDYRRHNHLFLLRKGVTYSEPQQ